LFINIVWVNAQSDERRNKYSLIYVKAYKPYTYETQLQQQLTKLAFFKK